MAPSVQAQNADAQLSLAISLLQKTVKAGSDVTVNISLTTNSGRPVKITWSNNDEPRDSEYGLDVQDENGKTPRRTQLGRVVVDKVPAVAVDSIHLPNRDVQEGETLNQRLVLNRFFDLAAPGKYTVQLVRHEGNTKSNLVSFTIEPK